MNSLLHDDFSKHTNKTISKNESSLSQSHFPPYTLQYCQLYSVSHKHSHQKFISTQHRFLFETNDYENWLELQDEDQAINIQQDQARAMVL